MLHLQEKEETNLSVQWHTSYLGSLLAEVKCQSCLLTLAAPKIKVWWEKATCTRFILHNEFMCRDLVRKRQCEHNPTQTLQLRGVLKSPGGVYFGENCEKGLWQKATLFRVWLHLSRKLKGRRPSLNSSAVQTMVTTVWSLKSLSKRREQLADWNVKWRGGKGEKR